MPTHKRKNSSGKITWYYQFNAPGSTREERNEIRQFGFPTKQAATDAEAVRRIEEQKKFELRKAGAAGVAAALPKTLAMLFVEFFRQHAVDKLAPKTVERYREMTAYIAPELTAMPLAEITPLHLSREWTRLLASGGHTRKTKTPRPMKAKSVRSIAGVVSSAFGRAVRWGLVATNPVTASEPPVPKKRLGIALTPAQHELVMESATSPWCLPIFLEVASATACRRGELLALRWTDIRDGRAMIARSLCQTDDGLQFKDTKTDNPHSVAIPEDALAALEAHRLRQDEFRQQFGPDYRSDLDLIFANPNGTPLKPDSISATVSLLFRKLNMPKGASLHSLRHTHVSELVDDGVPLQVISARLGHSSVRTTADIYAHMIHGQDDEAARRWNERKRRQAAQAKQSGAGCATRIQ